MKTSKHPKALDSSLNAATLAEAYDGVAAEIAAVPDEWLIRMALDVPRATQIGFGAAERVDELLPMLAGLSYYDVTPARKLRTYAAASLHTHLVAMNPSPGKSRRLPKLLAEGRKLRGDLMKSADTLAHFGLVSARQVANIRAGTGHLDMASDLSALAVLHGEVWSEVKDKVPITHAMVDRAAALGLDLQIALGIREVERSGLPRSEARKLRARAFTLFARAYDACRRGVTFLRWDEGDVDWYLPSIYVRRQHRPKPRAHAVESRPEPEVEEVTDAEAAQ